MKLKFNQSIATDKVTYNVRETYDVKDEKQAESFVAAGVAEKVEEPKKKQPKRQTQKKKEEPKDESDE